MANQLLLLNEFLPRSALGLGWLTESIKTPAIDACQSQLDLSEEAVLRASGEDFESLASSAKTNSVRLSLTKLLNKADSFKNSKEIKLDSVKVNRYQLRQPRLLFKDLMQSEHARSWLNDCIQIGRKSYLVVELQTAVNPELIRKADTERSVNLDLTVPVSTIATGGADVLGLGQQLDSSIGGEHSYKSHKTKKFHMEGEQIFAIGFKRIIWKSFGFRHVTLILVYRSNKMYSKDLDKARLEDKITWSVFGEKRGSSEEEVIGADIADELDAKYEDEAGEVGEDEDEDDEEEEDDDEELTQLTDNMVECGGQTFMIAPDE